MTENRFFKVKKVTKIEDLSSGKETTIPVSDLSVQDAGNIVQFEYVEKEPEVKKVKVKPGSYILSQTMSGVSLDKFEIKMPELLTSIDNTKIIMDEKEKFFSKIHLYDKVKTLRGKPLKRSILLCSPPGCGKSTTISKIASSMLDEGDTAVIIWNTTEVKSSAINNFFSTGIEYTDKAKKLLLIIEDINGGTTEDYHGPRGADTSLLNFLEGIGITFQRPTFILATTNNAEQSVGALIDRPGRFDKVIELKTPNPKETEELLSYISEKELSDEEKEAAKLASKEEFSIAHLQEVVVRSLLDDKTFMEVVKELVAHKKRFKNAFQDIKPNLGLR